MSKLQGVMEVLTEAGILAESSGQEQKADESEGEPEGEPEGEGQSEGEPEGEGQSDEEKPRLKLADLAGKLGVKARDLYDQVEIPMGGDQVMTLGEIKDLASQGKKALADIASVRETADNQSRELMLQRADLTKAAEMLAPFLKPEQQDHLAALNAKNTEREVKLLMGALPAWKNQDTAKKELGRMHKTVAAYGISASELDALVQDHRLVRLLRDVAMRTEAPGSKAPPKPGGRHTQNKPNEEYQRAKAPGASKADKLAAINSLLK
jgi:hypothetical protein